MENKILTEADLAGLDPEDVRIMIANSMAELAKALRPRIMRVGQVVKFTNPETTDEATERFRIIELRGDRVLVSPTAPVPMSILPTFVYLTADLETA